MNYLEKEKYSDNLVERLCMRFKNTDSNYFIFSFNYFLDIKEHHNCAYCMSLLVYNEKGLRKLIDYFENYRESLKDGFIWECL